METKGMMIIGLVLMLLMIAPEPVNSKCVLNDAVLSRATQLIYIAELRDGTGLDTTGTKYTSLMYWTGSAWNWWTGSAWSATETWNAMSSFGTFGKYYYDFTPN